MHTFDWHFLLLRGLWHLLIDFCIIICITATRRHAARCIIITAGVINGILSPAPAPPPATSPAAWSNHAIFRAELDMAHHPITKTLSSTYTAHVLHTQLLSWCSYLPA